MRTNIPQISKRVYKKDLLNVLEKKYPVIGPMWVSHQMEWCNAIYASFKDHNKFLILIYLIKKTLDFYSITLTKLTYVEFYSEDTVEIEKLNISDISKNINIPKESARRKIVELEAINAIIRKKKKILIDRSSFPFIKPINSIKRISRFISMFSKMLEEEKILEKQFSSLEIEKVIKENFSLVWKSYYELQIPMLMDYKKIFGDIESFHIWGTCAVNQHLYTQNVNDLNMSRSLFINSILFNKKIQGINAMSISDITGIPRATVVRKLNILVKKDFLSINNQKHYRLTGSAVKKLTPVQNCILRQLSEFSTTIFNLTIL